MPWKRSDYPENWRELRTAVQERAADRCEGCGVPNGAYIIRDRRNTARYELLSDEWSAEIAACVDGEKVTRIVCTTAHRHGSSRMTQNLDDLLFLCQRCHLVYDGDRHRRKRAETMRRKRETLGQLRLLQENV